MVASLNRPDEWKIEQGLAGAKLPILDQTGTETVAIQPQQWGELTKDEEAIKAVGDPDVLFARELEGWRGYVVIYQSDILHSLLLTRQLTGQQLCGMGEVSGEEGKGTQDTHFSDFPPKSRVPDGTYPRHKSCAPWDSLEDVASRCRW